MWETSIEDDLNFLWNNMLDRRACCWIRHSKFSESLHDHIMLIMFIPPSDINFCFKELLSNQWCSCIQVLFSICTAVLDLFRFGSDIAFRWCFFLVSCKLLHKKGVITLAYWGDLYIMFVSHLQLKGSIFTLRVSSSHRFFSCHDLCKQNAFLGT